MIYISIGSNLGDRLGYIHKALSVLKKRYIHDLKCSIVLETEAITLEGSPLDWKKPFLNAIAFGHSDLSPEQLLAGLKEIELELGRPAAYQKWAPRVIDLDILLWNDKAINLPTVTVPHPELCNRPFLLHLMAMINPILTHPTQKKTFGELSASPCDFIRSMAVHPKLVGVVNVTEDSFSDGGLYKDADAAIAQAYKLCAQGASVIEVGSQSTRPGAEMLAPSLEYERMKPVLDSLKDMVVSVDSFVPEVILKILNNHRVAWINDVSGNLDDRTIGAMVEYGCKIVTMHSLSIPPHKDMIMPEDEDAISNMSKWVENKAEQLMRLGFKQDSIIIDPGIGFGKSIYQNIWLMRHIKQIKKLGLQVFVGHSRKSYISSFSKLPAPERDLETIAAAQYLQQAGVDFIRVHNVQDHQRFFVTQQALIGGVDV